MQTTAQKIYNQLGGDRFKLVTGSKDFVDGGNMLTFKVGSNPNRITHVRITFMPDDTYTLEFMKVRGVEIKSVKNVNGVYAHGLREIFTVNTGLFTDL